MQLKATTLDILKYMSTINSSIVIKAGKKIESIAPGNASIAYFEGEDVFPEQVAIYNLNEFLGVVNAFSLNPDVKVESDRLIISQGRAKVTYLYADVNLLQRVPDKAPNFTPVVEFILSEEAIHQITKMSGLLASDDLTFVGDGAKITAKVHDAKNPSANAFELDVAEECDVSFTANIKISKMKLHPGEYKVEFSEKKIAKFSHTGLSLVVYVGLEATSQF